MNKFLIIFVVGLTLNGYTQTASDEFNKSSKFLEEGKGNLENGYWYDGYYFYKSLEHLANFAEIENDSIKIISHLKNINSNGIKGDKDYKSFSLTDLPKMATTQQTKIKKQLDSLYSKVKVLKSITNYDNVELLNYFRKINELQKFEFENGKFNSYDYKKFVIARAELEIKVGNINSGCELIYETDILHFVNSGYTSTICKEWYKTKSVIEEKKYKLEIKEKAQKWYLENPKIIKLRSLIGTDFTLVESFLGKPLIEKFRINAGVGNNGQQFIGNKYKNLNGIYEVGFKNGNVVMIQFFPSKYVKYSPETFDSSSSMFDLEITKDGVCSGSNNNSFVGNIKIFSIDYNCSNGELASTKFYGQNGKLISVVAY